MLPNFACHTGQSKRNHIRIEQVSNKQTTNKMKSTEVLTLSALCKFAVKTYIAIIIAKLLIHFQKLISGVFLEYNFRGGKSTFLEIEGGIKSKISGVKLFSGGGKTIFRGGGGQNAPLKGPKKTP